MPASESRFSRLGFENEQVFERVMATGLGAVSAAGTNLPYPGTVPGRCRLSLPPLWLIYGLARAGLEFPASATTGRARSHLFADKEGLDYR